MTIRAPHFSKPAERRVQQPQALPSLLLTTLFVAALPSPFAQYDWPTPRRSGWQDTLTVSRSITPIEKPFAQLDWPNPEPLPTQTPFQIGKSIALVEAVAAPFSQTDWPAPRRSGWQDTLTVSRSVTTIEKPFAQTNWLNPEPLSTQTPVQIGKSIALVETVVDDPFFQTDWITPPAFERQVTFQLGIPLEILGDAGEKPFFQNDWITPPATPTKLPEQIGKSIALVETVVEPPFNQTDWIIPPALERQQPLQIGKSIALVETVAPFFQTDWPQPEPIPTQTSLQIGKSIALVETDVGDPFSQTDWITPRRSGWQDTLTVGRGITEIPPRLPFALFDWPQPEPRPTVQLEQVSKSVALIPPLPLTLPLIAQHDWPNPILELLVPQFFGTSQPILDQISPPFPLTEFPNPTLAFERQTPFQVGMPIPIIQDAGEKPFHKDDWPNPDPFARQAPYQHPKSIALVQTPLSLPLLAQHDWPNPTLVYARQTPFQIGKSIALVEGVVLPPVVPPTGGWEKLSQFDDHIQRKRDQEQQRQKTLEAIEKIESPVDLQIARLLQKDVQTAETEQRLADLEQLITRNFRNADLPKVKAFNENVAKAFVRASVQGNFSAIQAFERELERAIEEEEFLLMALIMLE